MDLRSSYFMLLPFFQFLIQTISDFCHHNDTILLDIQLYLLLGLNIILNTILAGMTVSLNMFHKEYKGNEKLGATYNPLTNTIDFYGNKSVNRENILQHEFVHSTGNLGNVILNEGYTPILTSKVASTQEKIEYFIAYNLNDEVNAYTCYIKTIKQSNKFEENKELLLIK